MGDRLAVVARVSDRRGILDRGRVLGIARGVLRGVRAPARAGLPLASTAPASGSPDDPASCAASEPASPAPPPPVSSEHPRPPALVNRTRRKRDVHEDGETPRHTEFACFIRRSYPARPRGRTTL
jgi:hypothetical protein